jgi:hypothetical protein
MIGFPSHRFVCALAFDFFEKRGLAWCEGKDPTKALPLLGGYSVRLRFFGGRESATVAIRSEIRKCI